MTPDVNVLLAASRTDHPHHEAAHAWLEATLDDANAGGGLLPMPMVVASLLRLVTDPKIFVSPTPTARAVAFVASSRHTSAARTMARKKGFGGRN